MSFACGCFLGYYFTRILYISIWRSIFGLDHYFVFMLFDAGLIVKPSGGISFPVNLPGIRDFEEEA